MNRKQVIEHSGRVQEITEHYIRVNMEVQSACTACHAKSVCTVGDQTDKTVEITEWKDGFTEGELVTIKMEQSLGFKAVFLGYIFPFLILLFALAVSVQFTDNELITGLVALGVLPLYYGIIYLFRERIRKQFSFRIEKLV
jgi:positive regulator of sigma E activity